MLLDSAVTGVRRTTGRSHQVWDANHARATQTDPYQNSVTRYIFSASYLATVSPSSKLQIVQISQNSSLITGIKMVFFCSLMVSVVAYREEEAEHAVIVKAISGAIQISNASVSIKSKKVSEKLSIA